MKSKRAAGWPTPRARTTAQQVEAYRKLKRHLDIYCGVQVLEFDARAGAEFEHLQAARLRVGTMDLKVAAIALAHDATVLTRNISDFSRVPNLRVEDWTA
jgi:tRNA(fMet)-specific endonuclease VapC